jgi:hypothetical protein
MYTFSYLHEFITEIVNYPDTRVGDHPVLRSDEKYGLLLQFPAFVLLAQKTFGCGEQRLVWESL